MQLTRDLFAIAKFLFTSVLPAIANALSRFGVHCQYITVNVDLSVKFQSFQGVPLSFSHLFNATYWQIVEWQVEHF